ncbi:hypothetical protein B0H13DRAFT_1859009 [Mycena leptocephala]|nr:hypothetical protein B0H13DRAFT_1859009 [Mycena leptocephala]
MSFIFCALVPLALAATTLASSLAVLESRADSKATGPNQERQASKITRKMKVHSDDSLFHLNLHALHNAHLVRETLPRHLMEPKQYFPDRNAKHKEFAAILRGTGPEKAGAGAGKGSSNEIEKQAGQGGQGHCCPRKSVDTIINVY